MSTWPNRGASGGPCGGRISPSFSTRRCFCGIWAVLRLQVIDSQGGGLAKRL